MILPYPSPLAPWLVSETLASYIHRYHPPEGNDPRTLLLLHGTGGDENDLIQLGQMLAPDAGLLSPRGTVLENGASRFFRRFAEGVFDLEDLHARTNDLVAFLAAAEQKYGFDREHLIAVGFSNGANIAGSVLLTVPDALSEAILFRPMVPFVPERPLSLSDKRIFIGAGRADPIVPQDHPERLADLFRVFGADVTLTWQPGAHALTRGDVSAAYDWLEKNRPEM